MKKIKEVTKTVAVENQIVDEDDGLIVLLGKRVFFHCVNYNYIGKLVGVNTTSIKLEEARVVFETGPYSSSTMKISEPTHKNLAFIQISAIESFWEV
jgi:hypothetical protein